MGYTGTVLGPVCVDIAAGPLGSCHGPSQTQKIVHLLHSNLVLAQELAEKIHSEDHHLLTPHLYIIALDYICDCLPY